MRVRDLMDILKHMPKGAIVRMPTPLGAVNIGDIHLDATQSEIMLHPQEPVQDAQTA